MATASSSRELILFYVLRRLGLGRFVKPRYRALQGPETFRGLRVVTPGSSGPPTTAGFGSDVWTIDSEADMRRLLGYGVDGIMTDRPDVLAGLLQGAS